MAIIQSNWTDSFSRCFEYVYEMSSERSTRSRTEHWKYLTFIFHQGYKIKQDVLESDTGTAQINYKIKIKAYIQIKTCRREYIHNTITPDI